MPRRYGEQPRPRVLIVNADPSNGSHAAIQEMVPTVRHIQATNLRAVRQLDWDAAIVFGTCMGLADHMFVIQFGGELGGEIGYGSPGGVDLMLSIRPLSRSVLFDVPDGVPNSVTPLMPSLVDFVSERAARGVANDVMWAGHYQYGNAARPVIEFPFIKDDDGYVLAGCFVRGAAMSRWWWLPGEIGQEDRWSAAALANWAEVNPPAFPGRPDWQKRDEWSTLEEIGLRAKLTDLDDQLAEIQRQIFAQRTSLEVELQEQRVKADAGCRILLTGQGPELVVAVSDALKEIGFAIVDVDESLAKPGDKLEDLRVLDPDDGSWTSLVEVRGYSRGAALNDLLRIGRFESRYVQETGSLPSAVWYVVNQFLAIDPSARAQPLASSPNEVETFADNGGLVIDTRGLFRLVMSVRAGDLVPAEARAKLKETVGVFKAD
jgi:hypothetical protein